MPYILDEIDKPRRDWLKKSGVNYIVQILKENFTVVQWKQRARVFMILVFLLVVELNRMVSFFEKHSAFY